MAQTGWYPDPGGAPGRFRYWNGTSWSTETTLDPTDPPPGTRPTRRRGAGLLIGLLVGAVVLVLVVVLLIRGLINTDEPALTDPNPPETTVSGWDDSSPIPTDPPSPSVTPSALEPPPPSGTPSVGQTACAAADPYQVAPHPADGRVHGGRVSFPEPGGEWERDDSYARAMTWAYDVSGVSVQVEPAWLSMLAAGELRASDGFRTPKQAADGVMQCIASSSYYQNFSGRNDLHSKRVTVDGVTGWSLRSEVRVDDPDVTAEGDVVDVIVLDTGPEGSLSYFAGFVSIGDERRIEVLDRTIAALQVD